MGAFDAKSTSRDSPASEAGKHRDCAARPSQPYYSIDTATHVVSVRFRHELTFSDIAGYASRLRADPRFSPSFAEIVDLRRVESAALSASDTICLADEVDPFSFESMRAFVAQSQVQIHAAHLHRILRPESKTIRVFFSMDEARRWIEGKAGAAAKAHSI